MAAARQFGAGKRRNVNSGCQHYGRNGEQGRECMRDLPILTQEAHPARVPIGVQRRLRKTKIDIRPFARDDQLRGQKMIAFIPGESPLFGVD